MRLNRAHILSSCSACLVGMRSPEFGMQWFGVSGNIWMARQDCNFEYCSACFWLQSPISSHPLTMKIPLPMTQWGNPPSSGLRDLFPSSCGRGVGRTYMCHYRATEPKEQLLCTHLPWGYERAVIYLPASVKKACTNQAQSASLIFQLFCESCSLLPGYPLLLAHGSWAVQDVNSQTVLHESGQDV